jgi:hypothetical protein
MMLLLNRWELGIVALEFHSEFPEFFPCPGAPWTAILRFTVKKQIPINKIAGTQRLARTAASWMCRVVWTRRSRGSCRKEYQ